MLSTKETKALELLSCGDITQEQVAATLGVSPSLISQMLSSEEFKEALVEKRYETLQRHNKRDSAYDELEDAALEQLRVSLPMVMRPLELTRIIQTLNAAKRRGSSSPHAVHQQQNIATINMPTKIINQFVTNINNQVVNVGGQPLITMPSSALLKNLEQKNGNNSDSKHSRENSAIAITEK